MGKGALRLFLRLRERPQPRAVDVAVPDTRHRLSAAAAVQRRQPFRHAAQAVIVRRRVRPAEIEHIDRLVHAVEQLGVRFRLGVRVLRDIERHGEIVIQRPGGQIDFGQFAGERERFVHIGAGIRVDDDLVRARSEHRAPVVDVQSLHDAAVLV